MATGVFSLNFSYDELLSEYDSDHNQKLEQKEMPDTLMVKDHIFFIKNREIITVIDRNSGEVVKKERIGATGTYIASPLLAGNRIYVCAHNGKVSVLSADDYSVLSQNILNEKIGASPVTVDDVLHIRTDKHLYAFRE